MMQLFAPLAALLIAGFLATIFLLFRLDSRLDRLEQRLDAQARRP